MIPNIPVSLKELRLLLKTGEGSSLEFHAARVPARDTARVGSPGNQTTEGFPEKFTEDLGANHATICKKCAICLYCRHDLHG